MYKDHTAWIHSYHMKLGDIFPTAPWLGLPKNIYVNML